MRLPINLGLKLYLIVFAVFAILSVLSIGVPDGSAFIYYNVLWRLNPVSMIWYALAMLDVIVTCLCLVPLFERAFSQPPRWIRFYQWLFVMRAITFIVGHNYEFLNVRSAFHDTPLRGYLYLGIWLLFMYPSFKEHYTHSYRLKKQAPTT